MSDQPCVSVVLPVRNEAAHAREFLVPLLNQTYPKDRMEILVVDGMSEDGTREIIQGFIRANGHAKVRLLDNPKRQRAPALNVGIRYATGDVILRVDARTIIPNDYVEKCVNTLLECGADNVGGVQKPIPNQDLNGLMQQAIAIALSHPFGVGDSQFRLGRRSGYVDTVYLGCFRREVFARVGLFDEDAAVIGEDTDMNYRIRKAGGKVYLNTDIVAYYDPRDNLLDLWRLYFRYGGARAGSFLKTGALTSWRQVVPPAFIAALAAAAVGSLFHVVSFLLFLTTVLVYVCADVAVSVCLSRRHSNPCLVPSLLVLFPVIHCAWGLGFFRRLIQRSKPGQYWGY